MKKIIILLLILIILLSGCSSNKTNTTQSDIAPEVTVNLPKDDTVNGYRKESIENNSTTDMPNEISGEEVTVGTNKPTIDKNNNTSSEYCANKNSKVFHKADCGSVTNMKENNKYFADRKTLISEGYKPCGRCKP